MNYLQHNRITKMKILKLIFILTGCKFYFDYILPTNWASKNQLYRLYWDSFGERSNCLDCIDRIKFCYICGTIHLIGFLSLIPSGHFIVNLLVNIYPIMIQIYIWLRCKRIINKRGIINV